MSSPNQGLTLQENSSIEKTTRAPPSQGLPSGSYYVAEGKPLEMSVLSNWMRNKLRSEGDLERRCIQL